MKDWFKPGSAFNENEQVKRPGAEIFLVPFLIVLAMWFFYWLDFRFYPEMYKWGIYPLTLEGLKGILSSPLIHSNLNHLVNNSLPMLILGTALYYFYPKRAGMVLVFSWLSTGILVWFVARPSFHIGASGLVYALASFIFFSGLIKGKANLLGLSLFVAFVYGSLVWGLLPVEERISYEAHLSGAISGFVLAIFYRAIAPTEYQIGTQNDYWEQDDLSEQIEKYGEDYWMEHSSKESNSYSVVYHIKSRDES